MERNKIPVTALIMLIKNGKILLLRRQNTGYEDGKYSLPGGHVEKAEEIKEAAIREAKEEIGINIDYKDLSVVHVLNRKVKDNAYVDFVLKASKWNGNIEIKEKDLCDELVWADISNLPDNTIPFVKNVIENKSFYISYGWKENNI